MALAGLSAPVPVRAGALELVHGAGLRGVVRRASEHAVEELGTERVLPVLPDLRGLLPGGGLRRGATLAVAVRGVPGVTCGTTSLLLALLAAASQAGSWAAVVGVPTLGARAAAEIGVALDRLALVPNPGPDWASVVGALLDGLDIVVTSPPGPVAPALARRLMARARQRGSVLISYGRWDGADVILDAAHSRWHGLGEGRGRLQCRQLTVVAHGRGAAATPRQAVVWLPRPTGLYAELHPQLELTDADGSSAPRLAKDRRLLPERMVG